MTILAERRISSKARFDKLAASLEEARTSLRGKACVYLTGSFARGEAGTNSDLDLFIVGLERDGQRLLPQLEEIVVKAELIRKSRAMNFPDFSGDGEYLTHYSLPQLCDKLGGPSDDAENTFTARLLLLLESRCLLEEEVYQRVIGDVIAKYWRDFDRNSSDFIPAFLCNDIIRMWKTFCVNYEARTKNGTEQAKRRELNYKLKHSRMLTCYSGLFYLLQISKMKRTVAPDEATKMVSLTPTERLEWLLDKDPTLKDPLNQLLLRYEEFLQVTSEGKMALREAFSDQDKARHYTKQAQKFGDIVFKILGHVGEGSPLYRFVVV